ncbi:hypothetical protein AaE_006342 [Aphanomyces astaci]|uniref:Uncharacterized protein n=1 Tax=Aphanomyces astaci TaxID=112090 RepID=A0A6A5AFF7_APHAT|nr:hypothetical protein AaE_006342 [Aphanomyces astaci]
MVVCPDVDDPAAPVPARAWLLPVHSPNALEKIQELQDLIMTLFSNDAKNQSVSGAAVTSAVDSLLTSGGMYIDLARISSFTGCVCGVGCCHGFSLVLVTFGRGFD